MARVREYAATRGVTIEVRRFGATTRTAEDAAREIGTDVARIVKSLVFVADESPVIALCSGGTRVDEAALARAVGVPAVRRARPDEAKALTGYAIGGVSPFAHVTACTVVADEALLGFDVVWAAAGLPDAVFAIAPRDLMRVADAKVARIAG
ncbi:MAG: YbaK/EbsC family protein [Chloroflexi bacterium]|nr:MAG: YbaK/EbsC family protein [Chloroflexota bacterium]